MSVAKKLVKRSFGLVLKCFCHRKTIVFESVPDFSDNTFPVYQQMLERGLNKRYTFVWSCSGEKSLPDAPKGIRYIYPLKKTVRERLRNAYYMANAKCMICCNRHLHPWSKGQMTMYLSHGTALKNSRGYYRLSPDIDYCLAASEGVADVMAYQLDFPRERVMPLGYPRNDVLTQPRQPIKEMLGTDCKKVIVWYPTFRQHKNGITTGSGHALPIIHNGEAALALNDWARQMDVLLVLKPHFAQDLSEIKALELSNIRFIGDDFFTEHGTTSYGFVAGCDALITDYSSIYYDYLLCERPVGLIWEDLEEYRANPGFAVDLDTYCAGGVKIYTLEDFKEFVRQVAMDEDPCRRERQSVRDLTNYSTDGENTKRVTDFIIEKAGL